MSEQAVERYNVGLNSIGCAVYYKNDEGRFVRFSDYDALQSRLDAALIENRILRNTHDDQVSKFVEAKAELRQQLAERDAVLRELHAAWEESEGHDALFEAMGKVAALLSSAEPVKVHQGRSQISVPRELLIRAVQADASIGASAVTLANGWKAMAELRQIIADTPRECVVHDWAFDEGPRSCGNVCIKCGLPEPAKGGDGEVVDEHRTTKDSL